MYISAKFIAKHHLPLTQLSQTILPRNVDGTPNKKGAIRHAAILQMEMGDGHRERIHFLVTEIGDHEMLLGTDWLKAHNPSIDWATNRICMDRCPSICWEQQTPEPILAMLLPTCDWETQVSDNLGFEYTIVDAVQRMADHQTKFEEFSTRICRTSVSTSLAMHETKTLEEIPPEYHKYR